MALDSTNNLISLADAKKFIGLTIGASEVVHIQCTKDTASSLDGTYLKLYSPADQYYVWIDIADGSVDPAPSGFTSIEVDISANATAGTVATAVAAAITAKDDFTATATGANVEVTCADTGACTEAADEDTGFTVTRIIEGSYSSPADRNGGQNVEDLLNDLINQASWYLNKETCRELKQRSQTEYYDGHGDIKLYLDNPPVESLTLYQDADRDFTSDDVISSDDYELYATEGLIVLTGTTFLNDYRIIKATYTGGYSTIPYDLQMGCMALVAMWYAQVQSQSLGLESRSTDAGTRTFLSSIPDATRAAINRYQKWSAVL